MSGKGDKPRNCFSQQFRSNYDSIDWSPKRTSAEWSHSDEYSHYIILDPDGWDRVNWEYSFYQELISRHEFERRMTLSTINTTT